MIQRDKRSYDNQPNVRTLPARFCARFPAAYKGLPLMATGKSGSLDSSRAATKVTQPATCMMAIIGPDVNWIANKS